VNQMLKVAEKLYAVDTDSSDPNRAFKGDWPSTNAWRKSVRFAEQISPRFADDIIAGVADPEIATMLKISSGESLLTAPEDPSDSVQLEWHKSGIQGVWSAD